MEEQAAPSTYTIAPVPPNEYLSEREAEEAIHQWTRAHNYNMSRQKVEKNMNGEIWYRRFACDRSGKPKNTRKIADSDRKRPLRRTKRDGCPMPISIAAVDPDNTDGPWRIARDGSSAHSHPPSSDVRVHVAHRRQAAQKTTSTSVSTGDLVEVQTMAGVSTSRIYATMLMQDEATMLIPKYIANVKAAIRSKLLANRTSNEALFKMLEDKGFYYCYETDPESHRLIYLMWAHPATTKLSRDFMDLLILDCTYKTNRFRMPLLNAVILTGLNTILPFAQIWLRGEAEPDFTWALTTLKTFMTKEKIPLPSVLFTDRDLARTNATETVFPECYKMLCFWHIRRNVVAQAQKKLVMKVL